VKPTATAMVTVETTHLDPSGAGPGVKPMPAAAAAWPLTPLTIGSLRIDPPLVLAPIAGHSHAAFRELVACYGGCGLFYTEMLNSRFLAGQNLDKDRFLKVACRDRPLAAQVAGNDPEIVARAGARLESLERFAACDLNLGCPRGPIQRYGWGAALLADPERTEAILGELRQTWSGPLLVKMRDPGFTNAGSGADLAAGTAAGSAARGADYRAWHQLLERTAVDALVFHPRTAPDLFKRPARWDRLAAFCAAASLPVIGNGDIFSPQDAVRMFRQTGCHAVMVGRAALIRPWIFRDILSYLKNGVIPEPPAPIEVVDRFLDMLERFSEADRRLRRLRLFCFWFLQNFAYGLHYFKTVCREPTPAAMHQLLHALLAEERVPPYPCRPFLQG